MNKIFTKIASIGLGMIMAIGIGVGLTQGRDVSRASATTSTYNRLSTLTDGDEVLIVTLKGSKYFYLSTSNGSSKAPSASTLTVSGTSITGDYDAHLFTVEANGNNWKFKNNSNYLYTTTSNNGIRIGTNSNNSFTVTPQNPTNNYFQMKNTSTSRFVGVYLEQDWRCYNSATASNYGSPSSANQIQFFKKGQAAQKYTVSFNKNGGSGTMDNITDVTGTYILPENKFTAPENKAFAGWKANDTGDIIRVGDSYVLSSDVEFFAQWVDAYTVTYTAGTNGEGSFTHSQQPEGTYTLLGFDSLKGVSSASGYRFANYTVDGVDKDAGDNITLSSNISVIVNFEVQPVETTYDFSKNFSTYASDWGNAYSTHTGIDGKTDIGGDYAATIDLYFASKQTGTITDKPVFASKTASGSYAQVLKFTLNEEGYKIKDISVEFEQWGTKTPKVALYKGSTINNEQLDTLTIGTEQENKLSYSNLNDTVFSIGYSDGDTAKNVQAGLKSIYITLEALSGFGTLDHISITSLPNVVYHVGETFDFTGFAVTAYDGEDESTANFKDVTASVLTDLDDPTPFVEGDVPGFDCDVQYTGDGGTDTVSFHVYVYALVEYELVTSEPDDWSGQYLIVGTTSESDLVAMNGGLSNPDIESGYKIVTATNDVIEAGQELEWTIAKVDGGYSIQGKSGKYIGSLATKDNGMMISDAEVVNTLSINDSDVSISGTNTYNLTFSTTANRFRYYASGSVKLYKLRQSDNAEVYAQTFLNAIACDSTGKTAPTFTVKEGSTYWTWALLAAEYDTLTPVEKEQFRLGAASETGDIISQALARYDYIVGKYGSTQYSDFLGRNPEPLPNSSSSLINLYNDENSLTLAVIISSVTFIGTFSFFFIRKRRQLTK